MPIHLTEANDGEILFIRLGGKLANADYADFVLAFERLVSRHGKLRVLFDVIDFCGWDAAAFWADIKFDFKHFADIERLAMVGDKKWQRHMAVFCNSFTKATVRYFDRAEAAKARKWLGVTT